MNILHRFATDDNRGYRRIMCSYSWLSPTKSGWFWYYRSCRFAQPPSQLPRNGIERVLILEKL